MAATTVSDTSMSISLMNANVTQHVVRGSEHGRGAEAPVEANGEVHQREERRDQHARVPHRGAARLPTLGPTASVRTT